MEGMGLKFKPVVVRLLLGPTSMFGEYGWHFLHALIASPNSPNRGFNLPPSAHHLLPLTRPLVHATHIIIVIEIKDSQNLAVLVS